MFERGSYCWLWHGNCLGGSCFCFCFCAPPARMTRWGPHVSSPEARHGARNARALHVWHPERAGGARAFAFAVAVAVALGPRGRWLAAVGFYARGAGGPRATAQNGRPVAVRAAATAAQAAGRDADQRRRRRSTATRVAAGSPQGRTEGEPPVPERGAASGDRSVGPARGRADEPTSTALWRASGATAARSPPRHTRGAPPVELPGGYQ